MISAELRRRLTNIFEHTIATLACLLSIWLVHLALRVLLGPDWELFDWLPLRYFIDLSEATLLVKLLLRLIKEGA